MRPRIREVTTQMAESYMGGELGEAAALLNASTQHNMGETSFAEHVKDIYVGTGDSFLGMVRRGKIHQEQVAHMVRVLEEDLELYGATGMALPKDIAPIADWTPGFRKVVLTSMVQAGVDSDNTQMAGQVITGGAVPFIQNAMRRGKEGAQKLVGAGS